MSAANNGGPAFPEAGLSGLPNGEFIHGQAGMTLRDYFAAKADMAPYNPRQALESKLDRPVTIAELADYIAKIRHIEADAMLAERAK